MASDLIAAARLCYPTHPPPCSADPEAVRCAAEPVEARNPQQDGAAGLLLQGDHEHGLLWRVGQASQAVSHALPGNQLVTCRGLSGAVSCLD